MKYMFKDLPEGQTHYVGDSCKPRHKLVRDGNIKMDEDGVIVVRNWEEEFDKLCGEAGCAGYTDKLKAFIRELLEREKLSKI